VSFYKLLEETISNVDQIVHNVSRGWSPALISVFGMGKFVAYPVRCVKGENKKPLLDGQEGLRCPVVMLRL
jgi:hypothetical protein